MGIRVKSTKERKYDETSGLCAYDYTPNERQALAYMYCIDNDIIISPIAAEQGMMPAKWYVGISTPDDYKKVYKSKFQYDNNQIWEAMYEMCEYYYNKKK